jgi:hypothetical protein
VHSKKSEPRAEPASTVTAVAPQSEQRTKAASLVSLPEAGRPSAASLPGVVLDEAPPEPAAAAPDEAAAALALAAYGAVPETFAVSGLYTMRVHWRRRALRDEVSELRRAASDASLAGLEPVAAARKRDVRLRELALQSYDPAAFKRGTAALVLGAALLLLLFVAVFRAL